jgi:hypothetical protein
LAGLRLELGHVHLRDPVHVRVHVHDHVHVHVLLVALLQ